MQEATIRFNSNVLKVQLNDKVKLNALVNMLCLLGLDEKIEQITMKQTQQGAKQDD